MDTYFNKLFTGQHSYHNSVISEHKWIHSSDPCLLSHLPYCHENHIPYQVFYFKIFQHISLVSFYIQWYFSWGTEWDKHCVKSIRIQGYSFPHSDWIRRNTHISPYSFRMQENADQNNSKYEHFLHSAEVWNELKKVSPIQPNSGTTSLRFGTLKTSPFLLPGNH